MIIPNQKHKIEQGQTIKDNQIRSTNLHVGELSPHHLRFLDLWVAAEAGLPKKPQRPQAATLGEGGSFDGVATLTVRYGLAPPDLLRSNVALDPNPTLSGSLCSL